MPEITDAELRAFVRYQSFGTPEAVEKKVAELEKDNRKQRDEIRDMKDDQPSEGQLLLSKEDGERFTAYKEIGEPADVKTRLEHGVLAAEKLQGVEVRDSVVSFAKAAGLDEAAVDTLIAIPALKGAKFEIRKHKVKDDKDKESEVETPYITLTGDGEKAMSFEDAQGKVAGLKGLRLATVEDPSKPPGQTFVPQGGDVKGGDKGGNMYDKIRQDAESRKKVAEKPADGRSVQERLGMVKAV